jgi:hypothetical protein
MEETTFKRELEKFARWFESKEHGDMTYSKIVERYLKAKGAEITKEVLNPKELLLAYSSSKENLQACKGELEDNEAVDLWLANNSKLQIPNEKSDSWEKIFLELRLLRENPNSVWSRRLGEGFLEIWLSENFNPPTKKNK